MSLKKKITFSNGLVASYHKICAVERGNGNELIVKLKCYADATYRVKERKLHDLQANANKRNVDLCKVMSVPDDEKTKEQKNLIKQINADNEEFQKLMKIGAFNLTTVSRSIEYNEDDDDISFAGCYEKLKATDEFAGAEDC